MNFPIPSFVHAVGARIVASLHPFAGRLSVGLAVALVAASPALAEQPVPLTPRPQTTHLSFFDGETALSGGVYFLTFPNDNFFGYYSYLSDARYIYHFDLGYEYVIDAADGASGVYLYDFTSKTFFYTSPVYPFPYLYDFTLHTVLYYFPDPTQPGHYNTSGIRYFYDFATGKIITK